MSENIERLKTAIRDSDALDHESGCPICDALRAALAAVEQEMAALEAERDELRKRPTLEEVEARVRSVFSTTEYAIGTNRGYARDWVLEAVRALYAEEAAP